VTSGSHGATAWAAAPDTVGLSRTSTWQGGSAHILPAERSLASSRRRGETRSVRRPLASTCSTSRRRRWPRAPTRSGSTSATGRAWAASSRWS